MRRFWEQLTPAQRRGRLALRAGFRSAANEALQLDRFFPVPSYLWERWCPLLGVLPIAVYLELRRMCFVDRATGERRLTCWPKQETIARRLGVRKRHTIAAALKVLETHGLISRERTHYNEPVSGQIRRGVTAYTVWWEPPLVVEDAVALLLKEMRTVSENSGGSHRAENRPVGNKAPEGPKEGHAYTAEKRPSELIPRNTLSNVRNDDSEVQLIGRLRDHPKVTAMRQDERARCEALALELGERLLTWGRQFDGSPHHSEGFHRRVAFLMPETFVREALMATGDAVAERLAGREGCRKGPSAFFAGAVKRIAAREGVDLQLRRRQLQASEVHHDGTAAPKSPARSSTGRMPQFGDASAGTDPTPLSEDGRQRVLSLLRDAIGSWEPTPASGNTGGGPGRPRST